MTLKKIDDGQENVKDVRLQTIEEAEETLSETRRCKEELYKKLEIPLPNSNIGVNSIPIAWIEKYIQNHPEMKNHLSKMINDWVNEK